MTFDPNKVYGDVPESFSHRVAYALHRCEKEETKPMKRKVVVVVLVFVLCIAMTTTAAAAVAILSSTVDFFGWFYGEETRTQLEAGTVFVGGQTTNLNDVVFTLNEMVAMEQTEQTGGEDGAANAGQEKLLFFGTGTISVAEGENVVIVPRDPFEGYAIDAIDGYVLFCGEDAITYAELAKEEGACLRIVDVIPNGILDENGEYYPGAVGYYLILQEDGTIFFSAEICPVESIPVQESYRLSLYIRTQEVDWEGNPIEGTRHAENWVITLVPEQGE